MAFYSKDGAPVFTISYICHCAPTHVQCAIPTHTRCCARPLSEAGELGRHLRQLPKNCSHAENCQISTDRVDAFGWGCYSANKSKSFLPWFLQRNTFIFGLRRFTGGEFSFGWYPPVNRREDTLCGFCLSRLSFTNDHFSILVFWIFLYHRVRNRRIGLSYAYDLTRS